MALAQADVERIAHLARLAIEPDAVEGYADDLSTILTLVEQLAEVDTRGIEPMAHPLEMTQRLRDDEITESNQRDKLQAHAPWVEEGCFLVPRVIE
ncbi:Asp-tRNA(Asn)/Glu-tRNA(Gln) amidotransferase subunit GatC [Ectothiorhodospiraceae bacterium BW-2]|nr:Asp-tRNA(Asn)/Glu-tRNA(Gln) amidotransferase subunit GatC [Ectothiorhodospiraceae bacterium BW-2]